MNVSPKELDLFLKYHSPGSRYSYFPSVSYWKNQVSQDNWYKHLQQSYDPQKGIDLYIHIPFCESLCTFCGCNIKVTKNKKEGSPYVDAIGKEWNRYKKILQVEPNISSIYLGGGTPTFLSEKSLHKIFQFIFPKGPQSLHEGTVEIDPRFVNLEKLKLFKKYGIKRLSIGIQDLSSTVLENVNRLQKKEKVEKIVNLARKLQFEELAFDVIYGLPFQTVETMTKTFEQIVEMSPELVAFYPLATVPWQRKGQMAFGDFSPPTLEKKYQLYITGRNSLLQNGYLSTGMGFFIKKESRLGQSFLNKKIKRNLMSIFSKKSDFLLGLGVSSMSQVKDVLIQNERILEKYLFEIGKGGTSLWRTHKRSSLENSTQQFFENLISDNTIKSSLPILKEINKFKEDGLIEDQQKLLQITEKGKDFLKNIFQAIDPYLQ